ncbi:MAG TPA: carboxypeptidase regulatory-like domain-containing protein, partial [Planctomycetes bacterium]|nr:carboxypeptidase regulatory-like domain-containing protein [Planctomycetota bacterium]
LRIVLQRPHGLEGSVVDAAGEPMPDVFVTAADTTSRFSSTVATDGAGRFHFTRLPASRFRVSASQRFMDSHGTLPRFGHAEPIEDVPADTKDLLIRFSEAAPPTGSVRVRLLDARDGRPILTTPRVEVIGENLQRRGTPESAGTMVFPRLPMGEYQLRVEAKGYLSASRRVRVRSEGGPTVEEFRLEPAVGILVEPEVIDARELPSSAKIILIMSGGQGQGAFSYTQDFGEPIRLDNLHPGRWKLTAQILVRRRVVRSATKSVVINLAPRSGITRVRLRLVPVGSGKTPR